MKNKTFSFLALALVLGTQVPGRAQDDPRALMVQARAMQRRGGGDDPKGAAALYRKVIALVPTSAQAQLRLSEAILETGDLAGAVGPAVKATELDPRNGEAWAHLALLRFNLTKSSPSALALAIQTLKKATHLLPGDFELLTYLAEAQEAANEEEGAMQAWLSVGRMHPYHVIQGKSLADYAFEHAVDLAMKVKNYEVRREAVLALCNRPAPDLRYQRMLEELARDQVNSGFLGHAEESFGLLAQFIPQEPAIWENIAIIQLRTSRYEMALATLHKAEDLKKTMRVSFNIGVCLMRLGRLTEAEARWKTLLPAVLAPGAEDPTLQLPIKTLYANCLLMEGRTQDLLAMVATWPETGTDPELASLQVQALIQSGDWKQARTLLKAGMQRFPKQDLFVKAALIPAKVFEEGLVFKAESRGALTQINLEAMAGLWFEFNCWDKCLEAVQTARKSAPVRNVDLLLLEANALESLGQDDKALAVLREGQQLDPANPTLQNNLGYLLLEKGGDVAEASRLIHGALEKEPGNSSTMDSWGWALYKQGKFKESEEALRKASTLSPFSPEIHKHLGETLLKLDRLQEALDEWERALAFVFPERKELEKQVQDLRTRVARAKLPASDEAAAEVPPQEELDPDDESTDPL